MTMTLDFAERRILGVLLEKAFATPEQYPLTLAALVTGSNQKSCRHPVSQLGEEAVLDALDSLREKELVTLVRSVGGRTDRFKHRCGETLGIEGKDAAVIAELLLRGPQTDGELRQRASRLQRMAGVSEITAVLENLTGRDPPLARRLSSEGRRRGVRYAHTLYPPDEQPEAEEPAPEERGFREVTASPDVRREVEDLKRRVAHLETVVARLADADGGRSPQGDTRGEAEDADGRDQLSDAR